MKSTPSGWLPSQTGGIRLRPIILPSPPVKHGANSLKMRTRKRPSPKQTVQTPLPSINTLFESTSSSSSNSSYGSYCQFSPEGTYTTYTVPCTNDTFWQSFENAQLHAPQVAPAPPISANEHKPVNQPLFIQTGDATSSFNPGYPPSSVININELLLKPVPHHGQP
ncbi:unnamed protein product [Caenorhabditis bovis]|uniref:Uncharacterized protein n=1 Tax=Caenorhabditis bovis TaxID=2654633 RepID=A0A8S1E9I0_9PELO|nr:unnamed protein product [Caenorhabditis bovis]